MTNAFRLTTEPLAFVRYEVCALHSELNEHSVLTLKGIIAEEQQARFFQVLDTRCQLHYVNEDLSVEWHGIIKEMTLVKRAGQLVANVRVVGLTCLADEVVHTRTLDPFSESLQQVAQQLEDPALPPLQGSLARESFFEPYLIQYEETNWQFLKRQAARYQIPFVLEEMAGHVEILTDLEQQPRPYTWEASDYLAIHDKGATLCTLPFAKKTQQDVLLYLIGERLKIEGKSLIIQASTYEFHRLQSLQVQYELVTEQALRWEKSVHPLVQQTVQARILHTQDDKNLGRVAVCFPWEQAQAVRERLYPWATPFTANKVGFHALPEEGELVYVLFRTEQEADAFVYLTERTIPQAELIQDEQYWRTAQGVEIRLGNELVKLSIPDEKQSAMTLQKEALRLHYQDRLIEITPNELVITDQESTLSFKKNSLALTLQDQQLHLTNESLLLASGKQSILMQPSGIVMKGVTIELQAEQDIVIKGKKVALEGTEIDVKGKTKITGETTIKGSTRIKS